MRIKRIISCILLGVCLLTVSCSSSNLTTKNGTSSSKVEDSKSLEESDNYLLPSYQDFYSMTNQQILDTINSSGVFTGFTCYKYARSVNSETTGYQRTHLVILSEEYWLYQTDTHVIYYFRRECNMSTSAIPSTSMTMQFNADGKPLIYSDTTK